MRLTRENYLKMIRPYYEADLIKVITGVRRAGKSVILESIRDELFSSGIDANHIVYINPHLMISILMIKILKLVKNRQSFH